MFLQLEIHYFLHLYLKSRGLLRDADKDVVGSLPLAESLPVITAADTAASQGRELVTAADTAARPGPGAGNPSQASPASGTRVPEPSPTGPSAEQQQQVN